MSRKARNYFEASFYHVIIQGNNKEFIFKEDRFKNQYLNLFKQSIGSLRIKVIAYCIMGNHAHFLIQTESIVNLSTIMHKVNGRYAQYYNFMNERVGYVFRDRFLSEPILNQKYLVQCIKYIHLNPVKANITKKSEDYKYSSYNYYVSNKERILRKGIISSEEYNDICNSNKCSRNFLDIDRNINEDIENGIREYILKERLKLTNLFDNRKIFKNLLYYLKSECKINYKDSCKYFEISKNLLRNL